MGIFVSAAVFVGCQEDDPKSNELKIELSSETLEFDAPVADTKTVTLVSTRDWKVKDAENLPEWIAVNPLSGGATLNGTTVEITVTANAGTNRSESVVFTIGTLQTTLTVSQVGEGGSAEDLIVYHNDFDKELAVNSSGWPFLDSSDAWKNEKGTGISSVEYASSAVSVRTGSGFANSSNEGNTASVYAGSGKNNIFFASGNYFQVRNITLDASKKDYKLSFGAIRSVYGAAAGGSLFDANQFSVYVSNDGAKWVKLDYTFASGTAQDAKWDLATSVFTLPDNTSKLYLYFTTTEASTYRIDDLDLSISSVAGTAIDFSTGVELVGGSTGGDIVGTPEGDGSEASPYNVAGALAATNALAADSPSEEVYIKGIISSVSEIDTGTYGNATYYISDDGTTAGQFMVYRGYYLNGDKFTATDQIKVGDNVLICGKLINFKGNTPEVNTGSKIVSLNGKTDDDTKRLSVSTTSINVSAEAESATFKVSGNVSWTASVTEGSDWVTILYGESGNGADDVVLELKKNESEEAARTAKVTVSTTEDAAVKSYEITITQAKKSSGGSGEYIVDVLDRAWTGVTGTTYAEWKDKTATSSAVYAGQSAGGNESIQLRSTNSNSGIVTTTSGGKARKVILVWNDNTSATGNRKLDIYGKSTSYTQATDLYNSSTQGTLLGSIVCGTDTELEINGDYEFIGMRSNNGAMYITEIQILWE